MATAMAGARSVPAAVRAVIVLGVMLGPAHMVFGVTIVGSPSLGFVRFAGTDHRTQLDA